MNEAVLYLIPTVLEESATQTIPAYVLEAVKQCSVIFAENERTARRFLKRLDKEIVIDDFEWFAIHKSEQEQVMQLVQKIKEKKIIAIISEAGCPGVADPGQILIRTAQEMNVTVKPLVGPSSILLALMASGMNGQRFEFVGYLPIEQQERIKRLKEMEAYSLKHNCTQIFIETPYRNPALWQALMTHLKGSTRVCMASGLTLPQAHIECHDVQTWRQKNRTPPKDVPTVFAIGV